MPRPSGAPFWGEAWPPFDWQVLSGTANYVQEDGTVLAANAFAPGAARTWGEGDGLDGDDYVKVSSAAKLLWIFDSVPAYLLSGDTVEVFWAIRARGSGSFDVTNDRDTTWDYTDPAGAAIGSQTVSSGMWTVYEFQTTEYTTSDLLEGSGGYRLAVDVTGAVDIDVVQLRVYPPGGPLGGYSSNLTESNRNVVASAYRETVGATGPSDTDWGTAYSEVSSELDTAPMRNTGSSFTPTLTVFANANWISNLAGTIHLYRWEFGGGYLSFTTNAASQTPNYASSGTEGVDYIRRPDRTFADPRAYWTWGTGDTEPSVVSWLNTDVEYNETSGYQGTEDPGTANLGFSVVDYVPPVPGFNTDQPSPIDWPASAATYAINSSGSTSSGSFSFAPPLEPSFTLVFDHLWWHGSPGVEPAGLGAGSGTAYGSTASFGFDNVTAVVAIPPYKRWSPTAATVLSWVRNIQRNDGLGVSTWRWGSNTKVNVRVVGITFSGFGSNQSIRWRGTR